MNRQAIKSASDKFSETFLMEAIGNFKSYSKAQQKSLINEISRGVLNLIVLPFIDEIEKKGENA